MPQFTEIVRSLSPEKFLEILGASTRKAREVYFARHAIKAAAPTRGFAKPGAKNEQRAQALFEVLRTKTDDELAEEVLRSWLLTKRPLLVAALDFLKVPHSDGLTESDELSKVEKLEGRELEALIAACEKAAPRDEVIVYLRYMGCAAADKLAS